MRSSDKNDKQERKRRISAAIARELQVPPSQVADDVHIEFFGKNSVLTEGCLGVLEYGEECVSINSIAGIITYRGEELEICSYSDGRIELHGDISSVNFS